MKKLFIALLSVLMVAGYVYAAEEEAGTMFDFSGMLNTMGTYINNGSGLEEKAYDFMIYEMEFDADLKITPSDKTLIIMNMEIHDETWTQGNTDGRAITDQYDDNIEFKRAYGKYTFDNGWSTTFGLMTGGAFGTAFGDSGDGAYRWRVDGTTGFGRVGVILEKNYEAGPKGDNDWDAEKDDGDSYYAYWVAKFGDVTPMVLVGYRNVGDVYNGAADAFYPGGREFEDSDYDLMLLDVAVMGSAGPIGYEAEFQYLDFSQNWDANNVGPFAWSDGEDFALWGAYANVWTTMDAVKLGGYAAYGSWDNDAGAGYNMGFDFYFGEGIGEWQSFGTGNNGAFAGVTLLGLYADFSVNDALSLNGNVAYFMSNEDELANGDDSPYKDADGYELTGRAIYKLADNVTYTVAAAYGQFSPDKGDDPDPYARAYHKIQINF